MHNSEIDRKEMLYAFWNNWLDMKVGIEEAYKHKNAEAANMMDKAIENYVKMLGTFMRVDSSTKSSIEPLNGEERLQFIQDKISVYFAFVQLDTLYTEAMKKAVSQLAMRK
ncbi:YpoC family protein [Sporosarcina koreensis]|uniref:YpoC family protein n=1 Tax=Sporosarcina koreensis TaxID=334735 RepID=A0ABW0TX27_9BACL